MVGKGRDRVVGKGRGQVPAGVRLVPAGVRLRMFEVPEIKEKNRISLPNSGILNTRLNTRLNTNPYNTVSVIFINSILILA